MECKKKVTYIDYIKRCNELKAYSNNNYINCKIALLKSFTIDMIKPILEVEGYEEQFKFDLYIGEYGTYISSILEEKSAYNKFKPDVTILAIRLEEIYPQIFNCFEELEKGLWKVKDYIIKYYKNIINNIRNRNNSVIFINNFIAPYLNYGAIITSSINSQRNFIRQVNLMLEELANAFNNVYVIDNDNVASEIGKNNIYDYKMWYIAKNPYKVQFYIKLANEYTRYIKSIYGKRKKCIVVDLDNTIWGGIIGEDGINNIKLSETYPGKCYKDFQHNIKRLKNQGIILCICSKNNLEDVKEVFMKHPDMELSYDDFIVKKINWNEKYKNVKEIAKELNIGLDSLVFIDDSSFECQMVTKYLPEVKVIQLPNMPHLIPDLLINYNYFDTVKLTEEDMKKSEQYIAKIKTDEFKSTFEDIENFYKSLDIQVEIREISEIYISRVAQLTQKTNQFNLTTKRLTENELISLWKTENNIILYIKAKDKFIDNGVIGCAFLNIRQNILEVNNLMISCRAIGRNIEIAFMSYIYDFAKNLKINEIVGNYIPTSKNIIVEGFYDNLGFESIGGGKFKLIVNKKEILRPEYIYIISEG